MLKRANLLIIFLFMSVVCMYAAGNKDVAYKNLKIVGLNTIHGKISNPDVFFEDTYFEDFKPSIMLSDKSNYDIVNDRINASVVQEITDNNPNNPKSRIVRYQISKSEKQYIVRFNSSSAPDRLKGKTFFTNDEALESYASKVSKNNTISSTPADTIKIFQSFTTAQFEKMSKEIVQETDDFIEVICLIDGCYMCIVFRKIYG